MPPSILLSYSYPKWLKILIAIVALPPVLQTQYIRLSFGSNFGSFFNFASNSFTGMTTESGKNPLTLSGRFLTSKINGLVGYIFSEKSLAVISSADFVISIALIQVSIPPVKKPRILSYPIRDILTMVSISLPTSVINTNS